MDSYAKSFFIDETEPPLDAAHLNKIEGALAEVIDLANGNHDDLGNRVEYITSSAVDNATADGTIYYTDVGSSKALIIPVSGRSSQAQFRLDRDGKIYSRRREKQNGEFLPWGDWTDLSAAIRQIVLQYLDEHGVDLTGAEKTSNKANSFTESDADATHYPTTLAVKNYVAAVIGGIENAAY